MPDDIAETDDALIAAAQAGDEAAFARLVGRWKGRVTGLAARYARDDAELQDVVQEIFIRVWKGLPRYEPRTPFEHWLMRLAVRACLNHLRGRQRWWRLLLPAHDVESHEPRAPAAEHGLDDARAARAERLRAALDRREPEGRIVLTLLHLDERSVAEVAALTGWSESNVKVRAFRARARLKQLMTHHENET